MSKLLVILRLDLSKQELASFLKDPMICFDWYYDKDNVVDQPTLRDVEVITTLEEYPWQDLSS